MEKEIKFRAWYKKHKIMCDVAAINFYYGNVVLLASNEEQVKLFTEMNKKAHIDCTDRLSVDMKDIILMQCTGLSDKNEKKIYKGDIVKVLDLYRQFSEPSEFTGIVEFDNASFLINQDDIIKHYRWVDYVIEVIGNIYENPELLEGEECLND